MTENAIVFSNDRNEQLVGVWHEANGTPRATIVMLHGWSGTRCGPHQMLTRAARRFSAEGFHCLRFDFTGRGDSDGDTELATLASMQSDAGAALDWVQARSQTPVLLLGLCSGCEIVVAAASDRVDAAILWSAPIFAALPSGELAAKKRGQNFKKYARKLFSASTYLKLIRGQIDTKGVSKAMAGGGGAASKNIESNAPGQLPPGFRKSALEKWMRFKRPRLQVYGGADPITEDALRWYQENSGATPDVELVAGANHSFYGLDWEKEVFEKTLQWLKMSRY